MYVQELTAKNFRNYSDIHVNFSTDINFIIGNNGVGKTNILEAISVASNIKTFRNTHDSEVIKWNEGSYYCSVLAGDSEDRLFEVGCSATHDKVKKRLKIDGKEIKSASDYYGRLLTVILSPLDITIINGTPDYRRRFFDSVISKIDRAYFSALGEFKKVLSSRNRVLKEIKSGSAAAGQLDVWDTLFCEKAGMIINRRHAFVQKFNTTFCALYSSIAEDDEAPDIEYCNSSETSDPEQIRQKLIQLRNRDLILGATGIGPQRDDFILANARKNRFTNYASQGQRRTAAVALKVSECVVIEEEKNRKAVILVDDIFSELDEKRRSKMIDILRRGNQIIFTMVHFDPVTLHRFGDYKGFTVEQPGVVSELS
ncbi:MAG: DNA replication and repair protein RecF [Smithella sp.]|nr:DNA replication and repair protein RecF [Smithella sp.]